MKNFNRGRRGLPHGQRYACLLMQNNRSLRLARKDGTQCSDGGVENRKDGKSAKIEQQPIGERSLRYVPRKIGTQRGDGKFGDSEGRPKPSAYGLWPKAFIMLFYVLFSNAFRFRSLIGAKGLLFVPVMVFFTEMLHAQYFKPNETSLYINDVVPESFWDAAHTFMDAQSFGLSRGTLSKYKEGLLILDFWSTGCAACLASLKKLKEIKLANAELAFEVVPVTYQQPAEKATDMLKIRMRDQEFLFSSIVGDSILGRNFPHRGIPHMVWIYQGKVIAKPKWDYATIENFKTVLNGGKAKVYNMLSDQAVDPQQDLFTATNGATEILYEANGVKIARYLPGYQFEEPKIMQSNGRTVFFAINIDFQLLVYEAFRNKIFSTLDWQEGSGVFWLLSDARRQALFYDRVKLGLNKGVTEDLKYDEWAKWNMYCVAVEMEGKVPDSLVRARLEEEVGKWMQQQLGLYAEIRKHKILEYDVLKSRDLKSTMRSFGKPIDKVKVDKEGFTYPRYNQFFTTLKNKVSATKEERLKDMLLDSSGVDPGTVGRIWIPRNQMTMDDIQEFLKRYHLYLEPKYERVPVLLIQEITRYYELITH